MIIINIKGGIGNQFFQYSLGRKLSLLNNTELKFDTSLFSEDLFDRKFKLNIFKTRGDVATRNEINKIKGKEKKSKLNKKLMYNFAPLSKVYRMFYWRYHRLTYFRKPVVNEFIHHKYDSNILKVKDDSYLDGYWAQEKYFKDIRHILLQDFEIKAEYETVEYIKLRNEIVLNDCSVSIHIRRGYAKREIDLNIFGVLSIEYYKKAIQYINENIKNPTFYIFSDDIEWVKNNLNPRVKHKFLNFGSDGAYLELKLMSLCKHNIIANSTFSWWAAWLNENTDKIVIAPLRWYEMKTYQKSYEKGDLIPETWTLL